MSCMVLALWKGWKRWDERGKKGKEKNTQFCWLVANVHQDPQVRFDSRWTLASLTLSLSAWSASLLSSWVTLFLLPPLHFLFTFANFASFPSGQDGLFLSLGGSDGKKSASSSAALFYPGQNPRSLLILSNLTSGLIQVKSLLVLAQTH